MTFKKKQIVQGFDEIFGQWLNATVLDVKQDECLLRWSNYGSDYDSWTKRVREPVAERPLGRNAVARKNFPVREHPKHLQVGDTIFDTARKISWIVKENDAYHCEVRVIKTY